ncbi:EpsD family peptidyl-prolyl cis-trans isomerase [Derxia lacustris]|uniref:EpsD family peptidyl-prolyl cis-trans isomerase n=1 Tax=Derxia lacustris TaxID=764842 RepID=UPI000A170B55|nr:EpsD family peptidyl-prolyl cis-trans isomerase [Derxia lacustris]
MSRIAARVRLSLIAAALAGLLGACGQQAKAPTQVAARVDDAEISVHQINDVLNQAGGRLTPEQTEPAARRVLDGLVTQELLVQRARKAKLDDDPRVVRGVEAARRQILVRAYLEQRRALERKPDEAEVTAFFDANPALFRQRQVYALDEFSIEPAPGLAPELDALVARKPTVAALADWLTARGAGFVLRSGRRGAEQLPPPALASVKALAPGQSVVIAGERGLTLLRLASATPAPVSLDQARPAIEQWLLRERLARVEQQELNALRGGARIEYFGQFADLNGKGATAAPGAAASPPGGAAPAVLAPGAAAPADALGAPAAGPALGEAALPGAAPAAGRP